MANIIKKFENEVLKRIKLILKNQKNKIILSAEMFYQGDLHTSGGNAMVLLHCEGVLQ